MTRWFLDTEFNEDGRTIDLISIGLVSENGLVDRLWCSSEFDEDACNDWVKAKVLPHLPPPAARVPRAQIAEELRTLVLDGTKPEFWAYFADYDWVALCQLYGRMVDLPDGFPFYCRDVKQLMSELGVSKEQLPAQSGAEHDALSDARWAREAWLALRSHIQLVDEGRRSLATEAERRADAAEREARMGWESARMLAICFGAPASEKAADEALARLLSVKKETTNAAS